MSKIYKHIDTKLIIPDEQSCGAFTRPHTLTMPAAMMLCRVVFRKMQIAEAS